MRSRSVVIFLGAAAALTLGACDGSALRSSTRVPDAKPPLTTMTAGEFTTVSVPGPAAPAARAVRDIPAARPVSRENAIQARVEQLRRQLGPGFHIRAEWPFVAAGNDTQDRFDGCFAGSLMNSYRCLRRDYFTSGPTEPITVYLFRNDADYRRYAEALFGSRPDTPYGYYSHARHALVMNIATGGGTLVHELCHALIEYDFPNYPTWFNEGFASLHEQCTERNGSLVGLPNWRLPALQQAIREGRALALGDVMSKTNADSFYKQDKGLNYATARYLCQYIQQQGRLKEFYARLKQNVSTDPTGRKTLESVLGVTLDKIEADWLRWVMSLHFP